MASNFTSIIEFYLDTFCDFLMDTPIVYFTGALLSFYVIKLFRKLIKI